MRAFTVSSVKISGVTGKAWMGLANNPKIRRRVLQAIGARLILETRRNFGPSGVSRPEPWKPLSPKYAKRVKRPYATLDLTGKLFASFRMSVGTDEVSCFTTGVPYAARHQWGSGTLPARPYWPIDQQGKLTEYAQRAVTTAASLELQKIFRG